MSARVPLPLLSLDPELGQLLSPERLAQAERDIVVRVHSLAPGEWDAERLAHADPDHLGLLLVDGVLAREVVVADTVSGELLGPGDVVRPWQLHEDAQLLHRDVRWLVLAPSRVALLDRRFAGDLTRYPEITSALIDRLSDRTQRLAVTQAISQLNRVDRRLLALFWHLAERWGRVRSDGVAVPLVLSHRLLAQLVGARRPTVSTSLGELARREELVRRPDGTWLLTGKPLGTPAAAPVRVIRQRRAVLPVGPEPLAPLVAASEPAAWDPPFDPVAPAESVEPGARQTAVLAGELGENFHPGTLGVTIRRLRERVRAQREELADLVVETTELRDRTTELRLERARRREERPRG